jgi:hypothetical protein
VRAELVERPELPAFRTRSVPQAQLRVNSNPAG